MPLDRKGVVRCGCLFNAQSLVSVSVVVNQSWLYLQNLLSTDPKLETFMKDPSVSIADKRSKYFIMSAKFNLFSFYLMYLISLKYCIDLT